MQQVVYQQAHSQPPPASWLALSELFKRLELGDEALLLLNERKRVITGNPGATRLFQVAPEALCAQHISSLLVETELGTLDDGFRQITRVPMALTHAFPKGVLKARLPGGSVAPLEGYLSRIAIGAVQGFTLLLRDISAEINHEKRLEYLATHDSLTGLPNRLALLDRLDNAIRRHHRNETCFALIFVDLDHFKPINDRFGHEVGDRILCVCAERLKAGSRESDTVARLGGDEFVILVEELPMLSELTVICRRLVQSLTEQPVHIGLDEIHLGGSLGTSVFPRDGNTPDQLLRRADLAMYLQKRAHQRHRQPSSPSPSKGLGSTADTKITPSSRG